MRYKVALRMLPSCTPIAYGAAIRMDPVKIRVAIPAADPPDNNTHAILKRLRAQCALLWMINDNQSPRLSPPMVH